MYLHIFPTETRYSKSLLNMLNDNIDLTEHIFVFGVGFAKPNPIFRIDNTNFSGKVINLKSPFHLVQYFYLLKQCTHIYIHFLSYDPTLFFWSFNRKLLIKSTWIEWGSDIYSFTKKNNNLKTRIYEFMRKKIIPQFDSIAGFIDQDLELICKIYNTEPKLYSVMYPLPINSDLLDKFEIKKDKDEYLKILVGNSADSSNNHLEVFSYLSKFSDQKINILCPLSYGGTQTYIEKVLKEGYIKFKNKFQPILEPMSENSFAELLSTIDIGIMNHNRQQALGNIFALLYMGKKVYLRTTTTTYTYLTNKNIQIYNIDSLYKDDFETFVSTDIEKNIIREKILNIISQKKCLSLWNNLFSQTHDQRN